MELLFILFLHVGVGLAVEVNLMEPFEPSKITGTWYVARRNAQLLEKSLRCVAVELVKNNDDGEFTMLGRWIDEKQVEHNNTFLVVDDTLHPAKFVFKSDTEKIAVSFLGSDYVNWVVAYGKVSLKESFFVAYRKLPGDPSFTPMIQKVLDDNMVGKDFLYIDHSNC